MQTMIDIYISADKKSVFGLHDPVIDAIKRAVGYDHVVPMNFLPHSYENTSSGSKTRCLFVHYAVKNAPWSPIWFDASIERMLHKSYLFDMARSFAERVASKGKMTKKEWNRLRRFSSLISSTLKDWSF